MRELKIYRVHGYGYIIISRFETGKSQPTIDHLLKLANILNVGIDYFLYDLLPHNDAITNPTVQDAVAILKQMDERTAQYLLDIIKIYQASHQD
ncbi:XRE family transcriptional regulator [Ruminococcus sp. AF41-9]|nr:XRE family transcriptional regulator [Ruminococcus sp. AF41-9]